MQSADFEWETDDDQDWDDLQPLEGGDDDPAGRPWPLLILILIIVAVVAGSAYWLLDRRSDQTISQSREELTAVHLLLIEAVQIQDYGLFSSLISDEEWSWFNDQAQLLSLSLFWGRTALGLEPANDDLPGDADLEIVIDPDMQRARISHSRSFISESGGDLVALERTFLYEQSGEGWQLIRLEGAEFWGSWESQAGEILSLVYPQRDAETGRRLFPFLDELVNDYCDRPALNCPEDMALELKLDRREESLFRISEGFSSTRILLRDGRGTLALPAPSLIGRPLDDQGYEALARGYASWLGAVLINNFAVINQGAEPSVVSELLGERDLEPPPLPRGQMPWPATITLPAAENQPPHDILMMCRGGSQQRLLRFQTAEGRWTSEWPFRSNPTTGSPAPFPQPLLTRLPDYSGALVSFGLGEFEQGLYHTYLWREGQEQLLLEHDQVPHFWTDRFLNSSEQPFRKMNGYYLDIADNRTVINPWTIDIEACEGGNCEKMPVDGVPQWSPNGERTLLTVLQPYGEPQIHLGDDQGQLLTSLGSGLPVAWVDNERFTYLRGQIFGHIDPTQRGIWRALVLGDWTGNEQVIIDTQRLKAGIAAARASFQLGIATAEPYLNGWLIATRELGSQREAGSYLFFYQPQTDQLSLITENEMEMILPPLMLDIGGPYLAFSALRGDDFLIRFIDMDSGEEVFRANRFPQDWSADRRWLLFLEEQQLRVASPVHGFEWTIPHNLGGCYSAVWIEQNK